MNKDIKRWIENNATWLRFGLKSGLKATNKKERKKRFLSATGSTCFTRIINNNDVRHSKLKFFCCFILLRDWVSLHVSLLVWFINAGNITLFISRVTLSRRCTKGGSSFASFNCSWRTLRNEILILLKCFLRKQFKVSVSNKERMFTKTSPDSWACQHKGRDCLVTFCS